MKIQVFQLILLLFHVFPIKSSGKALLPLLMSKTKLAMMPHFFFTLGLAAINI